MDNASRPEPAGSAGGKRLIFPLITSVFVMLVIITIPVAPVDLDTDADTSFSAAVNYARAHGLHLGTDLVHTYGPLGHLIFIYFSPQIAATRMVADLALGLTVAVGLCQVAWRAGWICRSLLLGMFLFMSANVQPRTDLVIDIGSFCWGLLCCVELGRRLTFSAVVFTTLAAFSALAKNSFLFMGGLSVALIGSLVAARGRGRLASGMMIGFGLAVTSVWIAAGHGFSNVRTALVDAIAIVQGYNQAMGWDVLPLAIEGGAVVMALAVPMLMIRAATAFGSGPKNLRWSRTLLGAWLMSLLFLDWKHGFVRGDIWHVAYFFGSVPVLALAVESLPTDLIVSRRWARALAAGCCLICVIVLQSQYFPSPSKSLSAPFHAFADHVSSLLAPGAYRQRMSDVIEANRRKAELPRLHERIGQGAVDVFGQLQVYALLNRLNYHPRPVFQSYAAYNGRLMELNEQFYLSERAPEYVLFSLGPIDRRFPPLEDAMLFRDLILNFDLVDAEGRFLLLKSRTVNPPRLTLLRQGTVGLSEPMDLAEFGDAMLWLELDLEPSLAGRLRQFFYRPSTVRLAAWRERGGRLLLQRRAPPVMLAAGFVASPLISRNEDLVKLYEGAPVCRPGAYSVEVLPGEEHFWRNQLRFRIFRVEKGSGGAGL